MPAGVHVWLTGPAGTIEAVYTAEVGLCLAAPPGRGYTLQAEAPGYVPMQREITLKPYLWDAGQPQQIAVCLEPK